MIERACEEDVAFRVLAAEQRPDHATIARFVERHQDAIAGLFGEVLTLCVRSGLVQVGVIAVDGTKIHANAARDANLDYEQLAREIVEEAKPSTRRRMSASGKRAGTSCRRSSKPPRGAAAGCARPSNGSRPRGQPTLSLCRAAARNASGRPSAASRTSSGPKCAPTGLMRLIGRGRMKDGRRFGRPPDPYQPPATPEGRINVTDPDSHVVKGLRGFLQGYNAQAVTTEQQVVRSRRCSL